MAVTVNTGGHCPNIISHFRGRTFSQLRELPKQLFGLDPDRTAYLEEFDHFQATLASLIFGNKRLMTA